MSSPLPTPRLPPIFMKFIIGLGNPGREYVATRHNIGFELIDRFANRLAWIAKPEEFDTLARTKFDALVMDGQMPVAGGGTEERLLAKAMTFMNMSGRVWQGAV